MSKLTGITLIQNGNKLKYPWKECIRNLSKLCDKVFVNIGLDSDDGTIEDVQELKKELSNVTFIGFKWDMENKAGGTELAIQANNLLPYVEDGWILYLQADEFIRWQEENPIRNVIEADQDEVDQIEFIRTYFWGDLKTRASDYELWLGRAFKVGTHIVGGDGMHLVRKKPGLAVRVPPLIYHYSRMGTEEEANMRLRNLDSFYHPDEVVKTFKDFSYRECKKLLKTYEGAHPDGIGEFYE